MLHKEILKFKENYVEKQKINASKERTDITNADIEHLVVPNRYPTGKNCFEYFSGYFLVPSSTENTFIHLSTR